MKRIIRDKRQQLIWKESSWRAAKLAETRTYGVKVAAKQGQPNQWKIPAILLFYKKVNSAS